MINEVIFMTVLFLTGSLFIGTLSLGKISSPMLGFIAGCAIQIVIGTLFLMTKQPISPIVIALFSLVSSIAYITMQKRKLLRESTISVFIIKTGIYSTISFLSIYTIVSLLYNEGWVKYSSDSFGYMRIAHVMVNSGVTGLSQLDLTARLYGASLLHTPAVITGELYLRSVYPLLGISIVSALIWLIIRGCNEHLNKLKTIIFVIIASLLLISTNRFVFTTFYIHSHLVCTAMALLISGCGWLMVHDKKDYQNGYLSIISIAIFALIVSRAESAIIGFVALIPLISEKKVISIFQKKVLLFAFGIPTALYYGFSLITLEGGLITIINNPGMPGMGGLTLIIYFMLGIMTLCIAFMLKSLYNLKLFKIIAKKAMVIFECSLWVFLLYYFITKSDLFIANIYSIYYNFILGEGAWGLSVVFLTVLIILILIFVKNPDSMTVLRFPVTTFMPIMIFTAYLAGGVHRIGPGGSLNRMFIQIVPLAILFIVMSAALGELRFTKHSKSRDNIQVSEENPSYSEE